MENILILLLFVHIILYLAWKMTAMDEKSSRADGHKIPTYATGGLGNLIGFSLMTTGVGIVGIATQPEATLIGAIVIAGLVTYGLHYYWKQGVRGITTSLYLPDGTATLAGLLHLLYVFFIALMVLLFLTAITTANAVSLGLFFTGVALYGLAVAIDKKRGVI